MVDPVVVVVLDRTDGPAELAFQIRDTSPQLFLVHPGLLQTARIALQRAGVPEQCLYMFSDGENQPVDGIRDWHSLLGTSEEAENYRWPRLGAESTQKIAAINYSSGTTGFPKGVMITHYNLIANVEQVSSSTRGPAYTTSPSAERWISFLPLYHAFGQLYTCLLAAKLLIPVYMMKTFVFEDFLRLIETHKITDMQVAPPILVMLSKRPETSQYDLSSLKTIASGAAPLSKELQAMCAERYNVIITQGWGMTELTSAGTSSRVGTEYCGGSIGMLLPNCEARLLDEDGNEVKPHERGEIFIRGPNVSAGYWRNEEATRQAMLPDGWFRTGDIATHDETGRLWIVDRLKVSHARLPCFFHCVFFSLVFIFFSSSTLLSPPAKISLSSSFLNSNHKIS